MRGFGITTESDLFNQSDDDFKTLEVFPILCAICIRRSPLKQSENEGVEIRPCGNIMFSFTSIHPSVLRLTPSLLLFSPSSLQISTEL